MSQAPTLAEADELRPDGPVRESTIVVAGALTSTSRLATRFAPIPDPVLVAVFPDPGLRYDLEQDATTRIGRDPRHNDLVLVSPSVSSRHCEVIVDDDECSIVDLASSNGTFVNGERISAPKLLNQGDLITIGRYVFMFVWYRFARPPQPEVLSFRDLKQLLVKLYPTTESMHRLLLATNIRGNLQDSGDTSSDQAWSDLIEGFRGQDMVAALDTVIRFAMREHPGNRELERVKFTLDNWRHARKIPGLQERINADARNSARVVREILVTHLEAEGDSDSLSQMLDEVTEEASPAAVVSRQRAAEVPVVPRKSGEDLPFEVPEDSLISPPWATSPTPTRGDAMGRQSLEDKKPDIPPGLESPEGNQTEPPPLTSLARIVEEEAAGGEGSGAVAEATPPAVVSRIDAPGESGSAETASADVAPPKVAGEGHRPAMVEVIDDAASAQDLPALKELEDTLAPSKATRDRDADIEEFVAQTRGRSRRRIFAGFGVAAAGLLVATGIWVFGPGKSDKVPSGVEDAAEEASVARAPGKVGQDGSAERPDTGVTTSPGESGGPRGEPVHDAEEVRIPPAPAGTDSKKTDQGAATTVASRSVVGQSGDIPVVPQFRVINFVDDDGRPAYDGSAFSGTDVWDEETSQLVGAALSDCVWVDGRRKKLASKRSRLFLYIRCQAGGKTVEGWVYNRAMKRG